MDGIAAFNGIVELIKTANEVISFIVAVCEAGKARNELLRELRLTVRILYILDEAIAKHKDKVRNLTTLTAKDGWADQFKDIIATLIPRLTSAKGILDVYKRAKFVAKEKTINDELATLERYRGHFRECLAADQLYALEALTQVYIWLTGQGKSWLSCFS